MCLIVGAGGHCLRRRLLSYVALSSPHQGVPTRGRQWTPGMSPHSPVLCRSWGTCVFSCRLGLDRAKTPFFLFSPIYRYVKRHTYFRCILICAKKQCGSFLAPICWLVWCSYSVTSRQSPRPCGDTDRHRKAVETRRESEQTSKPSKEAAVPLQSVIAASP